MTTAVVLLASLFAIGWIAMEVIHLLRFLKQRRHRIQSYLFYEVRDQLYSLAVDGHIRTADPIYQCLERWINRGARSTRHYHLDNWVKAALSDPEAPGAYAPFESWEHFLTAMNQQPPEVRAIVLNLLSVFERVLRENTPLVVWLYRRRFLRVIGHWLIGIKVGRLLGLRVIQQALRGLERVLLAKRRISDDDHTFTPRILTT